MEDYLYKITVEIDDDKVNQLNQHDLDAVYQTVRDTFIQQDFRDVSKGKTLIFTIIPSRRAVIAAGIATNNLYDCWIGKYIKRMYCYNADEDNVEDVLENFKRFDAKYGKSQEKVHTVNYIYKITVEIDDNKVKRLNQHDLDAVYQTVRDTFIQQDFRDVSNGKTLIFTMMPHKDAFSNVGIVINALYDSLIGKYLKRMDWYDAEENSVEDVLKEFKKYDTKYGK